MKKSKAISLLLVTGLLGCNSHKDPNRLYMRTDTTGLYTPGISGFVGYYAFRPFGSYYDGGYNNDGSYSASRFVREGYSNAGVHTAEGSVSRGGFGRGGGFHASS